LSNIAQHKGIIIVFSVIKYNSTNMEKFRLPFHFVEF